jgi:hypothetical protein
MPRCDIIEDVRLINDLAMKAAPRKTGGVGGQERRGAVMPVRGIKEYKGNIRQRVQVLMGNGKGL